MSGAEDLARLTQTIDKTNELLLSPVPKMMDVGGGVMRPTNALVMTNLATLLGGAMPYASVALGLAGTSDGTNFSVLSSADDEYVNVYRNTAGAAVFVDTYPNASKVRALANGLSELDSSLDQTNQNVSSLASSVSSIEAELETTNSDVVEVTEHLNSVSSRLSQAQSDIEEVSSSLGGVADRVTSTEGGIAALDEGLNQAQSNIVDISSNLDGVVGRVAVAEDDIVDLDDGLSLLGDRSQFAIETSLPRNLSESHPWAVTDEDSQVILGVRDTGVVDAILDRLPGLGSIGEHAWAAADESGNVALGIRWDGVVDANLDRLPGLASISDFAWALSDGSDDTVILGVKWDREVVIYKAPVNSASSMTWVEGPPGQRDVWVLVSGVPYQLTSSGDNTDPELGSGVVNYLRRFNNVTPQSAPLPVTGSFAGYISKVLHILFNGQSLMRGIGSGGPITTQPPAANRLFTLNDGIQLADETGALSADMVAPFKPLAARSLESPALQAAANINRNRGLPADCCLLTSDHSRGAQGITSLNKGTIPYNNSITAATAAKAEADRLGYGYEIPFVGWNQGQHDGGMAAGVYIGHLLQLQTDYDADLRGVSGQLNTIPMLLTQMSNWHAPAYNRSFSNIPHEQLQAALENPEKFVMAGPQYWLPSNNDGIHLPAASYARDGVMVARAARAIIAKQKWLPLHCVSATRNGLQVDLRFHVPTGPLVIDTVNVTDPGMYGLRWIDSASSASVVKVERFGYDTLRLTLDAEPTGAGQMVGVADIGVAGSRAGPTTGARTCIRDSAPDLDATGTPVYNWACHQRIQVIN